MKKKTRNLTRRNWSFLIPQVALFLFIALVFKLSGFGRYWLLSLAVYFLLSGYVKVLIPKFHRKGLYYLRKGEVEGAAYAFERSYSFFTKYNWLDKYRAFFLFSLSYYSYREMALMNAMYCHSQYHNDKKTKELQKLLAKEFPANPYSNK